MGASAELYLDLVSSIFVSSRLSLPDETDLSIHVQQVQSPPHCSATSAPSFPRNNLKHHEASPALARHGAAAVEAQLFRSV